MATSASTAPLTLISADTHAGGSHEQYREYLDPAYLEDFDAWRGKYKNPFKDLRDTDLRVRNWDDERRDADELADGVVGEVVFPNTVPPFYPGLRALRRAAQARGLRAPARRACRAHNRWLVDFCARRPAQRAGDRARSSSTTSTTRSRTRRGSRSTGCAAACSLPIVPPDVKWVKPLYDPDYDRLWAALQDLDIPVNVHGGTGFARLRPITRRPRCS